MSTTIDWSIQAYDQMHDILQQGIEHNHDRYTSEACMVYMYNAFCEGIAWASTANCMRGFHLIKSTHVLSDARVA